MDGMNRRPQDSTDEQMSRDAERASAKSAFQLRITCIVPTRFRCTIGRFPQENWDLENSEKGEFVDAVKWQMGELTKDWYKATDTWLQLSPEPEPCLVETPIKHLRRKGTEKGPRRKLQIGRPSPKQLLGDARCVDAML